MEYELLRKPIKNMYVRVKPDGRVVVSAPRWVSRSAIDAFVASRIPWIERQRARQAARPNQVRTDADGHTVVTLWGKPYRLKTEPGRGYALTLEDDCARFTVPSESTPEARERGWKEALRRLFKAEVARRAPLWEARTGLQAAEWRTKFMTTRWGTCSVAARRIWLNVSLVHYPPECLDYVIVHELVHLRERSHGPRFQALMDEYYPHWRAVRRELNR